MKILVDMNLSPAWEGCLREYKIHAKHWSEIGPADAPDTQIMTWASREDFVVFTHDLDFGTILHLTAAQKPSVIQLRTEDVRPITMGLCVCTTILQTAEELKSGALVTIDPRRRRVTLLPLRR